MFAYLAICVALCLPASQGRELQQMGTMGSSMPMSPTMMPTMMMPMTPMMSMSMTPAMAPMTMPANVFAAVQMNSNLSTLATALMKANLSMALSDPMFVGTVFAPTNMAFTRYLASKNMTVDQLLMSPNLKMILEYHVVPGAAVKASMLMNGMKVMTMAGNSTLTITTMGMVTVFGAGSNAMVIMPDMMAGKAIIHVIDQVLIPPMNMMSS